jgi:hypothetical protein
MSDFDRIVTSYRQTCSACPTQYEGTVEDGRIFYFRYRGGWASLGLGSTIDEAVTDRREVGVQHGDGLDGCLDEDEFRELFCELARMRNDL